MKEIFQPQLQLEREPDGEYTLHAVTLCPNSGYSAGRARPGVPPTVRLNAETFSVLLDLRPRRGRALQAQTTVRHHLRNLKLEGKPQLIAFAMLRGDIVGSATIDVRASQECPRKDPVTVDTSDWYGWLNKMPGSQASFHVSGTVHLPSPGYEARLVTASPQGFNPRELILDLQITPRPGSWPQVITPTSVRYDQAGPAIDYDGVLVREPDGDAIHFEVDTVQ